MKTTSSSTPHPLRRLRIKHNLSQAALGKKLRPAATKGAISQWENGITAPKPGTAIQLVELFKGELSMDDLYRHGRAR
jgi:Helix-turn-helix.